MKYEIMVLYRPRLMFCHILDKADGLDMAFLLMRTSVEVRKVISLVHFHCKTRQKMPQIQSF